MFIYSHADTPGTEVRIVIGQKVEGGLISAAAVVRVRYRFCSNVSFTATPLIVTRK